MTNSDSERNTPTRSSAHGEAVASSDLAAASLRSSGALAAGAAAGRAQLQILHILERDARTTAEQIAAMVGMAEDAVRGVIAGFERDGLIRSYKTRVDWERAGEPRVFAFIDVDAQPERGHGYDRIAERIYRYPEVHSVYLLSGSSDLRVVVEGPTMQSVAQFVAEKLAPIEGIRGTATHFLLKKYKDDGVLFADPEPDRRLAVTP
jgi:DNA-binding Lrp family transcriptional regulator